MAKLKDFTGSYKRVLASILITDWSGMNSHQLQLHVTISFQTVMQESPHSLLCLEEIPLINLTCYCMQPDAIFTMKMDFPI